MSQVTRADPLSLLPTVLEKLPTLHANPTLAEEVLAAVRDACPTQHPQNFLIPLLPHLTAFALTAPPSLLLHSARTVVALVRSLASRRQHVPKVTQYLLQLVDLTTTLLRSCKSALIQLKLPSFPVPNPPSLSHSTSSLNALLFLLALHIPSTSLLPLPVPPTTASSSLGNTSDPPSLSLRLWLSVGSRARNAILKLASRTELLSGRCGHQPAGTALYILQSAFDPAASVPPPPAFRQRLIYVLSSVLPQSYQTATLLRIISQAQPVPYVPQHIVASNVPKHLLSENDQSSTLRCFSRAGMFDFRSSSPITPLAELQDPHYAIQEPPQKRRRTANRISSFTAEAESSPQQLSPPLAESVLSRSLTPRAHTSDGSETKNNPTIALQKEIESLQSVEQCATDPKSMLLLARATNVVSDALNSVMKHKSRRGLTNWLFLASVLSCVIRDMLEALQNALSVEMREPLQMTVLAITRILTSLMTYRDRVKNLTSNESKESEVPIQDVTTTFRDSLHRSVFVLLPQKSTKSTGSARSKLVRIARGVLKLATCYSDLFSDVTTANRRLDEITGTQAHADDQKLPTLRRTTFILQRTFRSSASILNVDDVSPSCNHAQEIQAAIMNLIDVIYMKAYHQAKDHTEALGSSNSPPNSLQPEFWDACARFALTKLKTTDGRIVCASLKCLTTLLKHAPENTVNVEPVQMGIVSTLTHDDALVRDCAIVCLIKCLALSHGRVSKLNLSSNRPTCTCSLTDWADDPCSVTPPPTTHCQILEHKSASLLLDQVRNMNSEPDSRPVSCLTERKKKLGILSKASLFNLSDNLSKKVTAVAFDEILSGAADEMNFSRLSPKWSHARMDQSQALPFQRPHSFACWFEVLRVTASAVESFRASCAKATYKRTFNFTIADDFAEATSLGTRFTSIFLTRLKDWAPHGLERALKDPQYQTIVSDIIGEHDKKSFWKKIGRNGAPNLVLKENISILSSLADKLGLSLARVVEDAVPEVIAQLSLRNGNPKDCSPMLIVSNVLEQDADSIIQKKAGKLVQRLIMEFGGPLEDSAKRALMYFAKTLKLDENMMSSSDLFAGALVVSHFMLVMDAVSRQLFHSRASSKHRARVLLTLEKIILLSTDRLHLYVPKVLATLKMALDVFSEDELLVHQSVRVWTAFLKVLGEKRIGPHLASIVSTLVPYKEKLGEKLVTSIRELLTLHISQQHPNCSLLALLSNIIKNSANNSRADGCNAVEDTVQHVDRISNSSQKVNDISEILTVCRDVGILITQHENGTVEVVGARHLLSVIRRNRALLGKKGSIGVESPSHGQGGNNGSAAAVMIGMLVEFLHETRTIPCQNILLECIGELGAVDPLLVTQISGKDANGKRRGKSSLEKMPLHIHGLVAKLLDDYLVPTLTHGEYQYSSSSRLNRIGLVIQELLKACGCSSETVERTSTTRRTSDLGEDTDWGNILVGENDAENSVYFWEHMRRSTKDVVQPYLAEPFDVHHYKDVFGEEAAGKVDLACEPVWSKVRALLKPPQLATAQEWRRQATVQLVDFIGVNGDFGKVLRALRPILRYEDDVTAFIFPLVFVTALDLEEETGDGKIKAFLVKEMSELLQHAAFPEPIFDLFDVLRGWREERSQAFGHIAFEKKYGTSSGKSTPTSGKRKTLRLSMIDKEKGSDPLCSFVDFEGREDQSISLLKQAGCALRARAFPRAILYAEYHIRNLRKKKNNPSWPSFPDSFLGRVQTKNLNDEEGLACAILQKCFSELEDADSMRGIALMRSSSSLEEVVLDTEVSGKFNEALVTYERAISESPRSEPFHRGFMQCLKTLGHWETLLAHAEGLLSSASIEENPLRRAALESGIDAAWRLGRWDALERLQDVCNDTKHYKGAPEDRVNWSSEFVHNFGRLLLSMHKKESTSVAIHAKRARNCLRAPFVQAAREGYVRCYPFVVSLHILTDVEESSNSISSPGQVIDVDNGENQFQVPSHLLISQLSRLQFSSPSLRVREQLLSTRRVCFEELGNHTEAAKTSLDLARISKENDNPRSASASAFRAMKVQCSDESVKHKCILEAAEIQKDEGDIPGALNAMKKEIERLTILYNNTSKGAATKTIRANIANRLCSSNILVGNLIGETRIEESTVVEQYFRDAAHCGPRREEPFYALGKHYDALLQATSAAGLRSKQDVANGYVRPNARACRKTDNGLTASHHSRFVPDIINSFSRALCNGHTHIFEALPRMLTVWFEFYSDLEDNKSPGWMVEERVRKEVQEAFGRIPMYMWMTAVSQLTSRILHHHNVVREELGHLLSKIICAYPDPSFWTILPSSQLQDTSRSSTVSGILNQAVAITKSDRTKASRDQAKALNNKIVVAVAVVRALISICKREASNDKRTRVENFSNEFKTLKNILRKADTITPMMPTMESLTVRLPVDGHDTHRPYAERRVQISSIEDYALVMASLMSPRRISLVGSDGKNYRYLAKVETNGDMRKDSRFVEFLSVVNRLLSKNAACRGKALGLKTYAVLPLTEQTGMIEWVNDLSPFRTIVSEEHSRIEGIPTQAAIKNKHESTADKKKWLTEWMFSKFPVVMDRFFVNRFGAGDGQSWLKARNEWTRSCAVWSMSGYIVGLGDRHGENVMIETTTGRCVHVDFAMLFEKGRTLRVPEIVPFRLTRNMVCAMGVSGYEGTFRCVSEVVMRVIRRNRDALLSVLESFLHDPLVDWGKGEGGSTVSPSAKREAWRTRAVVKDKLMGIVEKNGLPLSIEGQVGRVIREAVSSSNLSKMYIWWGPWL